MNKPSTAPSLLSADLTIIGTVQSDGEIQLDGQIEGDLKAGALIIGEKASVKGEVVADSVTIRGRVLGSVRGRQVQLAATARIEGDITHSALSVESGAFFEGHCRHAADPLTPSSDSPGLGGVSSVGKRSSDSSKSLDVGSSSPLGAGASSMS